MRTSPSTSLRLWRLVAGGRACKSQQRGSEGLWISRGRWEEPEIQPISTPEVIHGDPLATSPERLIGQQLKNRWVDHCCL